MLKPTLRMNSENGPLSRRPPLGSGTAFFVLFFFKFLCLFIIIMQFYKHALVSTSKPLNPKRLAALLVLVLLPNPA